MAVAVNGGRTVDETGEDGIDDGFSIRVWARLETSITDVGLANEIELLGKVVAGAVGAFAMEMGKAMSIRPFWGTLATLHVISMEPMTKLGRSAIAAATLRSEEFFMCAFASAGTEVIL